MTIKVRKRFNSVAHTSEADVDDTICEAYQVHAVVLNNAATWPTWLLRAYAPSEEIPRNVHVDFEGFPALPTTVYLKDEEGFRVMCLKPRNSEQHFPNSWPGFPVEYSGWVIYNPKNKIIDTCSRDTFDTNYVIVDE